MIYKSNKDFPMGNFSAFLALLEKTMPFSFKKLTRIQIDDFDLLLGTKIYNKRRI